MQYPIRSLGLEFSSNFVETHTDPVSGIEVLSWPSDTDKIRIQLSQKNTNHLSRQCFVRGIDRLQDFTRENPPKPLFVGLPRNPTQRFENASQIVWTARVSGHSRTLPASYANT